MKFTTAIGPVYTPGAASRWAMMALAFLPVLALAQGGDKQLHAKADALFAAGSYAQALPMYSQLVSLEPGDHDLNYRLGACSLYGDEDKQKAIGYLKFAVQGPATDNLAWYFLGRAYHLDYQFDDAITAYSHFRGTADKKLLAKFPVDALVQQCRNGKNLLSNIKDIKVYNKVEVAASDFFRFYDLSDIGGKIVTTPDELMTALDKKSKERSLVYLPTGGGTIYFSSYGKDGKTGRDIYRTELLPTGGFSDPVKLAGYVNTDQDEDYPVMSPDGTTFYFCSKGHNSMGGYDVFRCSYDKASGVFGPPENMDFAVNTPADEMLYIVGPDGKQACFASTRESRQDMDMVYRIGTTPAPVNLTVIKGTYASAFDIADRKAHIVVEDALTREKVADVKTDINGDYLLALPHGGRYSFLVEGGPSGKNHLGVVEVPSSAQPSAYAQEIKLVNEGGEKLAITNHFDQALHEDVMALALNEIKRRAKLDVTEGNAVAEADTSSPAEDPMDAAGFAGNMSVDDAQKLARTQQHDLTKLAENEGSAADAAYALAASNVDAAEKSSALAESLVQQAGQMSEGPDRDSLMTQAAVARQVAKEANDRASAALATGHDLKAAQQGNQDLATKAAATSASLAQAVKAKDVAGTTTALKQLKAQVDQQTGPKAALTDNERAQKAASDAEKTAAGKLAEANAQRQDEVALADRIKSVTRERDAAKGKKKDELAKQLATLEDQHNALVEEADAGFAKARKAQEDAAMARGQAALLDHITAAPDVKATATPTQDLAGVEQRMSKVKATIAALAIDQRYDASVTEPIAEKERRTFNWGPSGDDLAQVGEARSTEARIAMAPNTVSTKAASGPSSTTKAGAGSSVKQTSTTGTAAAPEGNVGGIGTDQAASGAIVQVAMTDKTDPRQSRPASGTSSAQKNGTPQGEGLTSAALPSSQQQSNVPHASSVVNPADGDLEDTADTTPGNTRGLVGQEGDLSQVTSVNDVEEQMFFAANKLAELKQLRQGASKKVERDSLDGAIHAQEHRMNELQQAHTELEAQANEKPAKDADQVATPGKEEDPEAVQYTLLDNDPSNLQELSEDDIIPGFTLRRKQIADGAGNAKGKAIADHQLEAELVDSIDAHLIRQTTLLAQHPEAASSIQPKIAHLQELRNQHAKAADMALATAKTMQAPAAAKPNANSQAPKASPSAAVHYGNFNAHVVIAPDPAAIYESVVHYRSAKARDAAAINADEVKQAKAGQIKIDSIEDLLSAVPEGGVTDDLQKQADKAKDDLLILRSEIGERTGFVMNEEYATALDSTTALDRDVKKLARPANDPLAQMAADFVQKAQADKDNGAVLRKNAAKTGNIVARDSLYRLAYADELHALQKLDQAITVSNYVLQRTPPAGENIAYGEVERRMSQGPADASASKPDASNADGSTTSPTATVSGMPTPSSEVLKNDAVSEVKPDHAAASDGKATGGSSIKPAVAVPVTAAVPGGKSDGTAKGAELSNGPDQVDAASSPEDSSIAQQQPVNSDTTPHAQTVREDDGQGRYFYLRARARAVRQDADAALADASARTDQAWELKNKAAGMSASGGNEAEAKRTAAQSVALFAQADSLRSAAQEMANIASGLDGQAAVFLTTIPKEQAGALVAMDTALPNSAPVAKAPAPAPKEEVAVVPPVPEKAAPSIQQAPVDTVLSTVASVEPVKPKPQPVPAPVVVPKPVPVPIPIPAPAPAPVPAPAPAPKPTPVSPRPSTGTAFAVGPDVAPRQGEIPMDVAMPKGLVYMVQVGAFRSELPAKSFQDMTPVTGIHVGNGLVRYSAGRFEDRQEAVRAQDLIRARGYKDAFVVAYMDGQRVTLDQAEEANGTATVAVATPAGPSVGTPSPSVTTTAVNGTEASALAKYPTSAQAVLADFHPLPAAENYYNDPTAAPAKQVENVKGLFFTVQVGVYSKPTALDRLFNITPLNSERTANDKIRYTTGMYRDVASASTRKDATVALGVTDAFVTAYLNGKRIPLDDARALLAKLGPSILVDPQLATP